MQSLKKGLLIILQVFLFITFAKAQEPCGLRITLLTCAPGKELYSTFGHTALRVQDSISGADDVFNYGTFEFEPGFYTKFIRGKLLYALSVEQFEDFLYSYQLESRRVVEQELILNCRQKQELHTALLINAKEENRYYRYDFLFDNCTTRARDMVEKQAGVQVGYRDILNGAQPSFRDLIHNYLNAGNQHWSKLGIDLLLGARLDRKVTNKEAMFLPDYLLKGFNHALVNGSRPLVTPPATVLDVPSPLERDFVVRPVFAFSLLLIFIMALSFYKNDRTARILTVFDKCFFLLLGLVGFLLLFMWFGTDHRIAKDNFNLLWAIPFHVMVPFLSRARHNWAAGYFRFTFFMSILLLVCWFFLPQEMNPGYLPLVLIVVLRSWFLQKK